MEREFKLFWHLNGIRLRVAPVALNRMAVDRTGTTSGPRTIGAASLEGRQFDHAPDVTLLSDSPLLPSALRNATRLHLRS